MVKELNSWLLVYVPNDDPEAVAEVAPPDDDDDHDDHVNAVAASVHAVPEP